MEPITAVLLALGSALLFGAYKKWGKPYLKKTFDDPNTPEDESDGFDALVRAAIDAAVAWAKAQNKGKVNEDTAMLAVKHVMSAGVPGLTREDAKAKVNAALGR